MGPTDKEWGAVVEKLETMEAKLDKAITDIEGLRLSFHRGYGILIGIAGALGVFATDVVNAIKRYLGVS